jgi:hypothetical protein
MLLQPRLLKFKSSIFPDTDIMASQGLTREQLESFNRDGYLIIPDALSAVTVKSLLDETKSMLSSLDLSTHPMTKFSTGGEDGQDHVGDAYFLGSGDKIRFFLEEDATFDPATGQLSMPKERAVNKIGHALHVLSEPFRNLLNPDAVANPASVANSLGFQDPRVLQSMVICKQPEIGGAVPPHQDSCFLYTNPPSAVGFWYALEDATLDNGCLSFLPGSHRWAPIEKRLIRKRAGVPDEEAGGTLMVDNLDGNTFPSADTLSTEERAQRQEDSASEDYVPGEVKAGSLVLIHGNLLHKSEKNLSQKGRIIYTFHIIEGQGTVYDYRNWLQPPAGGFTKLYA